MRVLAALDKFRGTVSARDAVSAVASACWELGFDVDECPMSDGGEGILEVLGGANRTSRVTGPRGTPVEAPWRLHNRTAVIEMALASGLELAGGPDGNDTMNATTAGTARVRSIELQVACDVRTRFVDAAALFAPQKGASAAEVNQLAARLNP